MKQVYELNSRVEYYVYRDGKKKFHRVGFVKAYRKGLFKTRYIVCTADKIREVDEIAPKQILGFAPKKEYKFNNSNKENENGN
jgi:hypothetical protein